MSSSHWRKLALGAVILGLAAYGFAQLWGGPRSAVAEVDDTDTSSVTQGDEQEVGQQDISEELRRRQRAIAEASWPPDPFRARSFVDFGPEGSPQTPDDAPIQAGTLALNGVIGGAAPLALINRRVVAVGDSLGPDVTVTAINDDSVTLDTPNGQRTLKLRTD